MHFDSRPECRVVFRLSVGGLEDLALGRVVPSNGVSKLT